jgi:hypothetical protein
MRFAAKLLSIVLHPLLMPLYTVLLALELDPHLGYFLQAERRWLTVGMLALMTVAFPITSALLLMRSGLVDSLEMHTRQERIAPYVMTLVYYGMTYYLLRRTPLHPAVLAMFIGAMLALTLTTVITLRWKISAHMVGIGGAVGTVLAIATIHAIPLLPMVAALILLAGLLGSARLLTSDHTQAQVLTGALVGALCTYFPVVLGWSL